MERDYTRNDDQPEPANEVVIDTLNSTTMRFNRAVLERNLEELLREGLTDFAVLAIDVDKLKQINSKKGLEGGDDYLRRIADAIELNLRPTDEVAGPGVDVGQPEGARVLYHRSGDEFFVILHDVSDIDEAQAVKNRLQKTLDEDNLRVSIGVAKCEEDDDVRTILDRAGVSLDGDKNSRYQEEMTFIQETATKIGRAVFGILGLEITRVDVKLK